MTDIPDALGVRGIKLWSELHEKFEFDPQETNLVLEVCRTLDTIDLLTVAIAADGVMVTGSQGQQVLNGAVAELRQQQAAYARLMTMLNLEAAENGVGVLRATSMRASAAADARWRGQRRANRA